MDHVETSGDDEAAVWRRPVSNGWRPAEQQNPNLLPIRQVARSRLMGPTTTTDRGNLVYDPKTEARLVRLNTGPGGYKRKI